MFCPFFDSRSEKKNKQDVAVVHVEPHQAKGDATSEQEWIDAFASLVFADMSFEKLEELVSTTRAVRARRAKLDLSH